MEMDFSDFVESLWPTAEELFPLPSLNSGDDSRLALPGGGLGHEASYSLTDDDFMAVLLDSHNPGVGGQRCATVDGQLSRTAFASTKSLHPLDSAARAGQPITPEKRRERKTQKSECRRYWTPEERTKFHEAMRRHGADIHAISKELGTRTTTQVRTHIQKYHLKLIRDLQAKKKATLAAKAAAEQTAARAAEAPGGGQ